MYGQMFERHLPRLEENRSISDLAFLRSFSRSSLLCLALEAESLVASIIWSLSSTKEDNFESSDLQTFSSLILVLQLLLTSLRSATKKV